MEKLFYLFRHGKTDWNAQRRLQGTSDIELNAEGILQARALIPAVQKLDIGFIASSPLSRAYETARIACSGINLPLIKDPGLMEVNMGKCEGMLIDDINKNHGGDYFHKCILSTDDKYLDVSLPGGETKRDALNRIGFSLNRIAFENDVSSFAVFSHGLIIKIFVAGYTGKEIQNISNADIIKVSCSVRDGHISWKFISHTNNSAV